MFADGWNLITQDALEVMSVCEELGIAVHLAGIFGGTTVSPIFDPMPEHAEQVAAWQALADRHGVSLAAVALGFAALPKCVEKLVVRPHFPWRFRKTGKTEPCGCAVGRWGCGAWRTWRGTSRRWRRRCRRRCGRRPRRRGCCARSCGCNSGPALSVRTTLPVPVCAPGAPTYLYLR